VVRQVFPDLGRESRRRIIRRFRSDIFPWIGGRPTADVTAPELLAVVRRIENRGALETAHRALGNCGQVFRYAVATGRAMRDPCGDLRRVARGEGGALRGDDRPEAGSRTAAGDGWLRGAHGALCPAPRPAGIRAPRRATQGRMGRHRFARGGMALHRDQDQHPAYRPPRQAVDILRELHPLTGRGRFVFPGARSNGRSMSDNAILAAMRRMGIGKDEMSGHGRISGTDRP
jgi:integrase